MQPPWMAFKGTVHPQNLSRIFFYRNRISGANESDGIRQRPHRREPSFYDYFWVVAERSSPVRDDPCLFIEELRLSWILIGKTRSLHTPSVVYYHTPQLVVSHRTVYWPFWNITHKPLKWACRVGLESVDALLHGRKLTCMLRLALTRHFIFPSRVILKRRVFVRVGASKVVTHWGNTIGFHWSL